MKCKNILVTSLFLFIFNFPFLQAQSPGSLDLSFDVDGKVTTDFGGYVDQITSMAIQSDGKILVVGRSYDGTNASLVMCRYNANGSLDNTFDTDGIVINTFGSLYTGATHVIIQPDGKILVSGTLNNGADLDMLLARYNTNGSLDLTFNSTGYITIDLGGQDDYGNTFTLLPDGKIVLVGATGVIDFDVVLARCNSNGTLDATFGAGGIVITDLGQSESCIAVTLQTDGKIVATGFAGSFTDNDMLTMRFNSNGNLDSSFNSNGVVTTNFDANDDYGHSVFLQPDGKMVVAGITYDGTNTDFALLRLNTNGTLDNSFDLDGKVVTDFNSGSSDFCNAAVYLTNNKILTAGFSGSPGDFAMALYNLDGSLETSFGSGGKITTDFTGFIDYGSSLCIQADDKIVVAGYTGDGTDNDFALARYTSVSSLSIETNNHDESFISTYPNPTYNTLHLNHLFDKAIIYTTSGQLVLQIQEKQNYIDVSNLIPATYILQVFVGDKTYYKKLIKM